MVLRGVASVHAPDSGRYLATLTDGELCGELAILDGGPRRADVVANTDVVVGAMTPGEFRSWMDSDSSFAEAVTAQADAHRGA
jgi:CRP-like cAMP-binding protein